MARIVCQFSCGAASAVAAKLMLNAYPADQVHIINAFVANEHPDNQRFLRGCEVWFQHKVTVLRDEKYGADTDEVWRQKRYMKGPRYAPCSIELKATVLDAYRQPGDINVLGYTKGEEGRLERFFDRKADHLPRAPLIEQGLTKEDCFRIVTEAGLVLPEMYELGYNNANCIGCVKGGAGYWNKIRKDFPERFEQIAVIQDSIGPGAYFLRHRSGPLKDQRFALRELPLDAGRYKDEPPISCGFSCEAPEDWDKEFTD